MNPCSKASFESKKAAKKRLKEILTEGGRQKQPLRSYKCDVCGNYHLTSMTKNEQKRVEYSKSQESRVAKLAGQWINKKGWDA